MKTDEPLVAFILHPSSFILPKVPRPGVEPGPPPSESGMIPFHYQGRAEEKGFEPLYPFGRPR